MYEAVRDLLPTLEGVVDTPTGTADVEFVDPTRPIKVVPILRAGLVLLEQAWAVLPAAETYHVGYVRDEETLQAKAYLNKLPATFSESDLILVADPMVATGGTMLQVGARVWADARGGRGGGRKQQRPAGPNGTWSAAAPVCALCPHLLHARLRAFAHRQVLADIVGRGADPANIRVVAAVVAPPGLKQMADLYPGLKVRPRLRASWCQPRGVRWVDPPLAPTPAPALVVALAWLTRPISAHKPAFCPPSRAPCQTRGAAGVLRHHRLRGQ